MVATCSPYWEMSRPGGPSCPRTMGRGRRSLVAEGRSRPGGSRVRITGIRSRLVELPFDGPFRPAWGRGRVQTGLTFVLYEVATDEGLVGIGAGHGGIESQVAIDRFIVPHLIGQDPTEIERHAAMLRDAEIMGPPPY